MWCPQDKSAGIMREWGGALEEKWEVSWGLVAVEQAIAEGSVMSVWEVRSWVKGKEVQDMAERMER